LIAELRAEDKPLAPGMLVTASVPTGKMAERLVVATDAILRDGGGYFVYKAQPIPEGRYMAIPVSVKVLYATENGLVIDTPELHDGNLVVVEGNERLRPMMPIEIARKSIVGGS
jgi:multidrug efflux pump subunit AcrA (membrane-fusion protein)